MTILPILVGAAALVSAVAPLLVKPWLRKLGVIDTPNERSSHRVVTLRGGGVAPLLGWCVGLGLAVLWVPDDHGTILSVGLLACAMSMVGLVDDFRGLRAGVRLAAQLVIGGVGATLLSAGLEVPVVLVACAAVGFAAFVNSANFMDGINGISGLHGAVVGSAFVVAGMISDSVWLSVLGGVLGAAFAAFLPWNLIRPGLFLGDVGSYLLGASIALTAMAAIFHGVEPLLVLAPLTVYIADTGSTVVRRFWRAEGVFTAHRTHAYQRLTDTGLTHVQASLVACAFSAVAASVGMAIALFGGPPVLGWTLLVMLAGVYLLVPYVRGSRLPDTSGGVLTAPLVPEPAAARAGFEPLRWVVFGASGFVGRALVERLRANGADVVALAAPRLVGRSAITDGAQIADEASGHEAVDELIPLLRDADVVVNAAGMATPDGAATPALFGANALLPAVLGSACARAGVARFVHLSSAAVQGRRASLDETMYVEPFSAYSRSKALGEYGVVSLAGRAQNERAVDYVILRATSVQGARRPTTTKLRSIARSPMSSVAAPGTQPTVVSSIDGLVDAVLAIGASQEPLPIVILQPWEGFSAAEVLELAGGGRTPTVLPRWFCRTVVAAGYFAARAIPEFQGLTRRVEMMWFGQSQSATDISSSGAPQASTLPRILGAVETGTA